MPTRPRTKSDLGGEALKKRKTVKSVPKQSHTPIVRPVVSPRALHAKSHHVPLLLANSKSTEALLSWFDSVSQQRSMPWRKPWINPEKYRDEPEELEKLQIKRAYEVWVSEIMLQQTRVSAVIPYFNEWISRWPTVEALSKAQPDDVFAVWKGLGYYSRATRLQLGAQKVVDTDEFNGKIPDTPEELQKLPGVGRYTAGAVSSIVFGRAVPLLDGNVMRVLCRQLGLYADLKNKKISDTLWEVADTLVKHASNHGTGNEFTETPGKWNQGLMELGSTVCTPRPKCEACPIQATCRTFAEAKSLFDKSKSNKNDAIPDIEDACVSCEAIDEEILSEALQEKVDDKKQKKPNTLISSYFSKVNKAAETPDKDEESDISLEKMVENPQIDPATLAQIKSYCSMFPKKAVKGKVKEEELIVCVVKHQRSSGSKWLIEQRPSKGLLASLWQFPLHTLPSSNDSDPDSRKSAAIEYASLLFGQDDDYLKHEGEIGSLTHVFSHLRWELYIHYFVLDDEDEVKMPKETAAGRRWIDGDRADDESFWTGIKRSWEMVKEYDT